MWLIVRPVRKSVVAVERRSQEIVSVNVPLHQHLSIAASNECDSAFGSFRISIGINDLRIVETQAFARCERTNPLLVADEQGANEAFLRRLQRCTKCVAADRLNDCNRARTFTSTHGCHHGFEVSEFSR